MSSNLQANSLFRVDGMVAVITGGGTGKFCFNSSQLIN
jgi:hypothetical protein